MPVSDRTNHKDKHGPRKCLPRMGSTLPFSRQPDSIFAKKMLLLSLSDGSHLEPISTVFWCPQDLQSVYVPLLILWESLSEPRGQGAKRGTALTGKSWVHSAALTWWL